MLAAALFAAAGAWNFAAPAYTVRAPAAPSVPVAYYAEPVVYAAPAPAAPLFTSVLPMVAFVAAAVAGAALVGKKVPSVELHTQFGLPGDDTRIDLSEFCKGKKVVLVGLPGAFTPTWSTQQVPGYLKDAEALKAAGVDEVIIYCVNDMAVMDAWALDQGVLGNDLITMMADPKSELTKALGMELTAAGPLSKGLFSRSKRVALYAEDGEVKVVRVAEAEDDPAGDDRPDVTLAPAMLEAIKGL